MKAKKTRPIRIKREELEAVLDGQKQSISFLPLAFLFPLICMLIYMMGAKCSPFGTYSMLYSDNFHQYFPFFKAFRQALRNGDSLLYSWDVGMGVDYWGLIAYYLASPLNLLSVFVPDAHVLGYFSLLVPIKMSLASLFFAIFLKKLYGKDDISLAIFGTFYGMCAWAMGYQWNIMWMDGFALLPLVALGTICLLRDKKFILYTISLFLAVASNYYVGFFVCIFVFLLFFCYEICRATSVKRMFADLARIAFFSALAIGMTAFLTLPAFTALQSTQSSVNSFPEGFSVNIATGEAVTAAKAAWETFKTTKAAGGSFFQLTGLWFKAVFTSVPPLWDGMVQVAGNMGGSVAPTFKEGLPNLYCGVGSILLAFMFLTTKHVRLSDKICSVALLVFFILSFIIRQLDYIWHGFHFPNMIPYRFSFLFSFVLLYMAYRAYCLRRHIKPWQILIAGALALLLLCQGDTENQKYLPFNIIFLFLYLGCLLVHQMDNPLPKKPRKKELQRICKGRQYRRIAVTYVMLAIMTVELIMNTVNFSTSFARTDASNYPKGTASSQSAISYMKEYEALRDNELFYRTETTHSQTLNDGALNNYYGISTFTSSANVKVTEFMKTLGYGAKNTYNRYCFEESSPVANLFLNLKYMIERDGNVEENPYFNTVYNFNQVYIQQNNAYLPLGFLAESTLADLSFENGNIFNFQNELFKAATGLNEDVWSFTPYTWLRYSTRNDVVIDSSNRAGYVTYKGSGKTGYVDYWYEVEADGFLCLDITMPDRNTYNVYRGTPDETGKISYDHLFTESISLPQTIAVGQVRAGETIKIAVTCKENSSSSIYIKAAMLDDAVFRKGYEILSASTLDLTSFSNTEIEGVIHCNRDGLLYTSIPQNGSNWHAYVDGVEVQPKLVGNVMLALDLTEGDHTIRFEYHNPSFNTGLAISLISLGVFAITIALTVTYPKYQPLLNQAGDKLKAKFRK